MQIEKSGDLFRLMYDTKGRFVLHTIAPETEGSFKLARVMSTGTSAKKIPFLVTHDGRTIRYPDPLISKSDTVKIDLATGKITEFLKFEVGTTVMITKGRNTGRVGTLVKLDAHPGSFDIAQVKDSEGNTFATRKGNVFCIGKGSDAKQALISLPRGKGIKRTIFEVRRHRANAAHPVTPAPHAATHARRHPAGARQEGKGAEGIEPPGA